MSYRDQFSKEEWFLIQSAPLWVLAIVGGIDGKIDKKEMQVFTDTIISISKSSIGLTREVYKSVIDDISSVINTPTDGETALKGLFAVNHLLKGANESEAKNYKESLILLGKEISEASGGFFKKRSDKETQALGVIASLLELI